MNWNEVSIHTTPHSYPDSATRNADAGLAVWGDF